MTELCWQQTELLPPDRVHLQIDVYIVGASQTVACTCAVYEGAQETLTALQTEGVEHSVGGLDALSESMMQWMAAASGRCTPF